jgi:methylphosphotriester-DNA--protein-cysteine methyltransferase
LALVILQKKGLRHIEFFDTDHFENNYHRVPPPAALGRFIDFFWETKFEPLWTQFPKGFSDAQFANIGYTYIINLGTPFIMQVDNKKFSMRTDGFLPRYHAIECYHKPGNHFFGIKFRVSPVLLEKKINFSEYKGSVFPLSYLLDQGIIDKVKNAGTFEERTTILSRYFISLLARHDDSLQQAAIVSRILDRAFQHNSFNLSLEQEAKRNNVSLRTLQRYFENCTGTGSKTALQVMRVRKAVAHIVHSPETFHYTQYGYHDHSHFYKHLKQFLQKNTFRDKEAYLRILRSMQKKI